MHAGVVATHSLEHRMHTAAGLRQIAQRSLGAQRGQAVDAHAGSIFDATPALSCLAQAFLLLSVFLLPRFFLPDP